MSILEAWAYELPVVMTDYCNLPEGFSADAAIHIDTEVESMSAGMIKMIECSDAELKGMGVNGLNLVKEKFTWPTIALRWVSFINGCASVVRRVTSLNLFSER